MRERRNDLEIMNQAPQIALQTQNSDQSPLYDVRNHACHSPGEDLATCEVMFRGRLFGYGSLATARLRSSSYAGHASHLFGCATRSPEGEAWWSQTGSNRRPHACKARALPAELWPRNQKTNALCRMRDALDQSGGPGKT